MPFVRRVVVANPLQVRSIAWAKVRTDKIDAAMLAKLHASGFLPEVWIPNEETEALRRRIAERNQLVSQRTQLKKTVFIRCCRQTSFRAMLANCLASAAEHGSTLNHFRRIRGGLYYWSPS